MVGIVKRLKFYNVAVLTQIVSCSSKILNISAQLNGCIGIFIKALVMLQVDENGLDEMDRRLLTTLVEQFDSGPVGINSLAAALSEERGTLEDVVEPYLIQQGYVMRTSRGRQATKKTW